MGMSGERLVWMYSGMLSGGGEPWSCCEETVEMPNSRGDIVGTGDGASIKYSPTKRSCGCC